MAGEISVARMRQWVNRRGRTRLATDVAATVTMYNIRPIYYRTTCQRIVFYSLPRRQTRVPRHACFYDT